MHNYASVKTGAKIWIRECPRGNRGHQGENQTDPGPGPSPLGPLRQHVQVSYFQAELVGGRNWPSISSNRQKKWYIQSPAVFAWQFGEHWMNACIKVTYPLYARNSFPPPLILLGSRYKLRILHPTHWLQEKKLLFAHATVNISLMPRNACHRASKWPQGLLLQLHLYLQTYNALFPLNQCRGRSQSHFIGWLLTRHDWIFVATEIVCFWIKCTLTLSYQYTGSFTRTVRN